MWDILTGTGQQCFVTVKDCAREAGAACVPVFYDFRVSRRGARAVV